MNNIISIDDDRSRVDEAAVNKMMDDLTKQIGSEEESRENAETLVKENLFSYIIKWAKKLGVKFIDMLVYLWCAMTDPEVPLQAKLIAIAALIYFISPIDAIPDFLPFGFADDAAALAAAIAAITVILVKHGISLNIEQKKKEFDEKIYGKKAEG